MEEEKKQGKDRKVLKAVVITIVIISAILILTYFGLVQYDNIYQKGAIDGANELYSEMLDIIGNCESIPITIEDEIYNIILFECLSDSAEEDLK